MAPTLLARANDLVTSASHLFKRDTCYDGYYYYSGYDCGRSGWYVWGRWVVLGVVLLVAFLLFLSLACLNSRRRRRRGAQPLYGTGWMAPGGQANYNQAYYGQQPYQSQYQQPAPAYDAQGQTTGQAQGYYGGNVQTPQNAYQPSGYAPPSGPPPAKYN